MKKTTDKNYQVLEVLKFLMSNWATNDELQTKFDLSKRTVGYYISAYRKTGFEVETKDENGFFYHIKNQSE